MKIFKTAVVALVAICLGTSADAESRKPQAIVDIIAYNDVYELLQDNVDGMKVGGPSRVVPIVKKTRAENPNTLVLFAGDTMSPSLWSSQFKGMQMVEAHNALGTDFGCLGNHEFDFGLEAFYNVTRATTFQWVNSNCRLQSNGRILPGTRMRGVKEFNDPQFGKIKIGVLGIMYDMKDSGKGLVWADPIESARVQAKHLKERENCDLVIALTHQDLEDDNRLSSEVKEIDIIYGGHDHRSMLQTNYGAPYLKADFNFRSIWKSRIEFYPKLDKKNPAHTRMMHQAIPISEELPSDGSLDTAIQAYASKIEDLHKRVIGSLCAPLDLTNNMVRASDAPVGHIFADAMLVFYGKNSADIAMMNGGGIRTDQVYPAGELTVGQIVAWSPFGNTIILIETDGASVKKLIEHDNRDSCADGFITNNGHYVHPAGIKYTYKCTGVKQGEVTSVEYFKHPTKTGPLLDTDVVKLAINNYVFNTRFTPIPGIKFKFLKNEQEAGRIDTALEQFASQLPNKEICYTAEGRSEVSF